jgi:hypothetical protein
MIRRATVGPPAWHTQALRLEGHAGPREISPGPLAAADAGPVTQRVGPRPGGGSGIGLGGRWTVTVTVESARQWYRKSATGGPTHGRTDCSSRRVRRRRRLRAPALSLSDSLSPSLSGSSCDRRTQSDSRLGRATAVTVMPTPPAAGGRVFRWRPRQRQP